MFEVFEVVSEFVEVMFFVQIVQVFYYFGYFEGFCYVSQYFRFYLLIVVFCYFGCGLVEGRGFVCYVLLCFIMFLGFFIEEVFVFLFVEMRSFSLRFVMVLFFKRCLMMVLVILMSFFIVWRCWVKIIELLVGLFLSLGIYLCRFLRIGFYL